MGNVHLSPEAEAYFAKRVARSCCSRPQGDSYVQQLAWKKVGLFHVPAESGARDCAAAHEQKPERPLRLSAKGQDRDRGSLAAPPLPHHRTYGRIRRSRVTLTRFDQMIRLVLAGRSDSCTTESDSMSSRNACRASPVGADEKSSPTGMSAACRFRDSCPTCLSSRSGLQSPFPLGLSVDSAFRHGVPH